MARESFENLKEIHETLSRYGSEAERFLREGRTRAALMHFLSFGEYMSRLIVERLEPAVPNEDFAERVKRLEDHLPQSIIDDFGVIRDLGNIAIREHGKTI